MLFCPSCGLEFSSGTTCPDCNILLENDNTTHCQHCQTAFSDNQFFCQKCGRFCSSGREKQFRAQTQNNDVLGSCIYCGTWIEDANLINENEPIICNNPLHTLDFENWKKAATVSTMIDAIALQSLLDINQIPVKIINQQDRSYVVTQGDLSVIKLLVPDEYLENASELLKNNK